MLQVQKMSDVQILGQTPPTTKMQMNEHQIPSVLDNNAIQCT